MLSLCADSDPWLLEDDGIIDLIAVEVAVCGQRPVRLTRAERETAGIEIILNGGSVADVIERLRLPVEFTDSAAGHVITRRAGKRMAARGNGTRRRRVRSARSRVRTE